MRCLLCYSAEMATGEGLVFWFVVLASAVVLWRMVVAVHKRLRQDVPQFTGDNVWSAGLPFAAFAVTVSLFVTAGWLAG